MSKHYPFPRASYEITCVFWGERGFVYDLVQIFMDYNIINLMLVLNNCSLWWFFLVHILVLQAYRRQAGTWHYKEASSSISCGS